MNREEAKELLPIIQAFANGGTIQFSCNMNGPYWQDMGESLSFKLDGDRFRIKPEPEVIYVSKHKAHIVFGKAFIHKHEREALSSALGFEDNYEYIAKKFIEAGE